MIEEYSLSARYSFISDAASMTGMKNVRNNLDSILQSATALRNESRNTREIGANLGEIGRQSNKGLGAVSDNLRQTDRVSKAATKNLQGLKAEYRALRAESRNSIDFGDLTDEQAFRDATRETEKYVQALKSLEDQTERVTTAGREFNANLKLQQKIAKNRILIQRAERDAVDASQRLGYSQSIKGVGENIIGNLSGSIQDAQELQQSFGSIKKLAGDLSDKGFVELKNNILSFSAAMGVADIQVSAVYEDLAGAGKNFEQLGNRFSEVDQILKNSNALDVTAEKATQLDITLGSIYKGSLSKYGGGIVELNARTASAINDLSDKLQDVRISAEDVIPTMNVMMNSIGDAANFPLDQIAAFSAGISSVGTIEPEAAGSFFNRLGKSMAEKTEIMANALKMSSKDFDTAVNTDKLGIVLKIAETYKNMEGGELVKGAFLGKVGIKSAQDQKLIQAVANNIKVFQDARNVAKDGFYGEAGKDLSVQAEVARVMETSAFQARRFNQSITALKHTFGLAIQDGLTPFMSQLSGVLEKIIFLTQKYPKATKLIALSTIGFGALSVVIGTAGIALFSFQQAAATSAVALLTLRQGMVPLTGFFATSMEAFTGSGGLFAGVLGLISNASSIASASLIGLGYVVGIFINPFTITLGLLTGLYVLLQKLSPEVNLLSVGISKLVAPIGYVYGFIKGFGSEIWAEFSPLVDNLKRGLLPAIAVISTALKDAMATFSQFAGLGEASGREVAHSFINAVGMISQKWDAAFGKISSMLIRFYEFAKDIGYWLVSVLADNSPGPTDVIPKKWTRAINYIQDLLVGFWEKTKEIGRKISDVFNSSIARIQAAWAQGMNFLQGFLNGDTMLYAAKSLFRRLLSEILFFAAKGEGMFLLFQRITTMGIVPFIANLSIPNAVFSQFSGLEDFAFGIFTFLSNFVPGVSESIRKFVLILGELAAQVPIFTAFAGVSQELFPLISATLGLAQAMRWLQMGLGFLQSKFQITWLEPIVSGLKEVNDRVDAFITQIENSIVAGVSWAFQKIVALFNAISRKVVDTWNATASLIVNLPSVIADASTKSFNTLLTSVENFAINLVTTVGGAIVGAIASLPGLIIGTVRGVFERLNLENFLLLFASSLPFGLFTGKVRDLVIASLVSVFPGLNAILGPLAFGQLFEAIAFALPAAVSALVASGITDKIFNAFNSLIAKGLDYATQAFGGELPAWVQTIEKFVTYLDTFLHKVGEFVLSLPDASFYALTAGAILAVVVRFQQATIAVEGFIQNVGGIEKAILLAIRGLGKLLSPLRFLWDGLVAILTGPPPDFAAFFAPLIMGAKAVWKYVSPLFNQLATLLKPFADQLATIFKPFAEQFATVIRPLLSVLSSYLGQVRVAIVGIAEAFAALPIAEQLASLAAVAGVFSKGVAATVISAGMNVARGVQSGATAARGAIISTIDVVAPALAKSGEVTVRLLGLILRALGKGASFGIGALLSPVSFLKDIASLTNLGNISKNAGRVTPIDLLPFFEDIKVAKIQKDSGIILNQLGLIGQYSVQARYLILPFAETLGGLGVALLLVEGYLRATNSQFSIFGTIAYFSTKAIEFASLAIAGLRIAWVSLRYLMLDLSDRLIPQKLADATPEFVKKTSAVLKFLEKAFIAIAVVTGYVLKGLLIVAKQFYNVIVRFAVVPALKVLQLALIGVQAVFKILTGDFSPISKLLTVMSGAFVKLASNVWKVVDACMPLIIVLGALAFPGLAFPLMVYEIVRGGKDIIAVFTAVSSAIKAVSSAIYEFRGTLAITAGLLAVYFNFGAPWVGIIISLWGWVYELTTGFKDFKDIIGALQIAIDTLASTMQALMKSVLAPLGLGPLEGVVKFVMANWPFLLGGLIAFNTLITKDLFQGIKRTFSIIPKSINIVAKSFQRLTGIITQLLPLFNVFRREAAGMQVDVLRSQASAFQGQYIGGGGTPYTLDSQRELKRREDSTRFRTLLEQAALEEARNNFIKNKRSKTETVRVDNTYNKRLINPRAGALDPRNLVDILEARTIDFNSAQMNRSRESVLNNRAKMAEIAQKSGVGNMPLEQLQLLSTREGRESFIGNGMLPGITAKDISIEAGTVNLRGATLTGGQRKGITSQTQLNERDNSGAGTSYGDFNKIRAAELKKNPFKANTQKDSKYNRELEAIHEYRNRENLREMLGEDISAAIAAIENISNLDQMMGKAQDLRSLAKSIGINDAALPPQNKNLHEFDAMVLRRRVIDRLKEIESPGNFNPTSNAKNYSGIIRVMQDEKEFRRYLEGLGYENSFIEQAQKIAKNSSSKKGRNSPIIKTQKDELIASLLATEFSNASGKTEPFYQSPLIGKPGYGNEIPANGVEKRSRLDKYFGKPAYIDSVAADREKFESKKARRNITSTALSSWYRNNSTGTSLVNLNGLLPQSKNALQNTSGFSNGLIEAALTKIGYDDREIKTWAKSLAESPISDPITGKTRLRNEKEKRGEIKKMIALANKDKGLKAYWKKYMAMNFLQEEAKLIPTHKTEKDGIATESYSMKEIMKNNKYQAMASNLIAGNFSEVYGKGGVDFADLESLASGTKFSAEELYFGKSMPRKDKIKGSRLRRQYLNELAQQYGMQDVTELLDVANVADKSRGSLFREGISGKSGATVTRQIAQTLGMDPSDLMMSLTNTRLLEQDKATPKGFMSRISPLFDLRNLPAVGGAYDQVAQTQSRYNEINRLSGEIRDTTRQRGAGLDALLANTGGSLPDILKRLGSEATADDVRKAAISDPKSLHKILGQNKGKDEKNAIYQSFFKALDVEAKDFMGNLKRYAPDTFMERLENSSINFFKDYGDKLKRFAGTVRKNAISLADTYTPIGNSVVKPFQKLRQQYNMDKDYSQNKNNLNYMMEEAGFSSYREFSSHLSELNVGSNSIKNLLSGNISDINSGDLKTMAEALGHTKTTRKKDVGVVTEGDDSIFKADSFTVKPNKKFKSFLRYAVESMFSNRRMRTTVMRNLTIAGIKAIRATKNKLVKTLEFSPKAAMTSLLDTVERFGYSLSTTIAGDGSGVGFIARAKNEVRRLLGMGVNTITRMLTSPLKLLTETLPKGTMVDWANGLYAGAMKKLSMGFKKTGNWLFTMANKSEGELNKNVKSLGKFLFGIGRDISITAAKNPTLASAIKSLFGSISSSLSQIGKAAWEEAKRTIGSMSIFQKFKDFIKNIPGFDAAGRASRVEAVKQKMSDAGGFFTRLADTAKARKAKFSTAQGRGLPGGTNAKEMPFSITNAKGKRSPKIEKAYADTKRRGEYERYLMKGGYNIQRNSELQSQSDPETINGPVVRGFQLLAKASILTGEQVERALSNPVIYVLSRWTDVVGAITGKLMGKLKNAVAATGRGIGRSLSSAFNSVKDAVDTITLKAAYRFADLWGTASQNADNSVMRIVWTISDVYARVTEIGGRIRDKLTGAFGTSADWVAGKWSFTINFITGLFTKVGRFAKRVGRKIMSWFSDASPGPTQHIRDKYEYTATHVNESLDRVADHAKVAGQQVEGAMTHGLAQTEEAAHATGGAFMKLQHAIMGIGGLGVGLSSLGTALAESNPPLGAMLTKMSEATFLVDSLMGGVYAIQQLGGGLFEFFADEEVLGFLGKVKSKLTGLIPAITAFGTAMKAQFLSGALFSNPIFLAIAGISAAVTGLYFAFKNNFMGIADLGEKVGSVFQRLADIIHSFIDAISVPIVGFFDSIQGILPQLTLIGGVGLLSQIKATPIEKVLTDKFSKAAKLISPITSKIAGSMTAATMANTHYGTLGVAATSSTKDIRKAYHQKAKAVHPDLNPDPKAVGQFEKLTEAYKTLSDAELRMNYNARLAGDSFQALRGTTQSLAEVLEKRLGKVGQIAANGLKSLPELIEEVIRNFGKIGVFLGGTLGDIGTTMVSALSKAFSRVAGVAGKFATKFKGMLLMFFGPIDVLSMGLSSVGERLKGINPFIGSAVQGLGDFISTADMIGNISMGLAKVLPKPFKDLIKKGLTSIPVLDRVVKAYRRISDEGYEYLNEKFKITDKLKAIGTRISTAISPAIATLQNKFAKASEIAVTATMSRWQDFKKEWPKLVESSMLAIGPSLTKTKESFTKMSDSMKLLMLQASGKSMVLAQPLLKAATSAAISAGMIVPANTAIAGSMVETQLAAQASSLAIVKYGGSSALAVTTEAGVIVPLNLSIAGSMAAVTTSATAAATATWAVASPFLSFGAAVLTPLLPVILAVAAAFLVFGAIYRTNLFGWGEAVRPLVEFTGGLLKIVGAVFMLASGLFMLRVIFKVVSRVISNVKDGLESFFTATEAGKAMSIQFEKLIRPLVKLWRSFMTISETILGFGRGADLFNLSIEGMVDDSMKAIGNFAKWMVKTFSPGNIGKAIANGIVYGFSFAMSAVTNIWKGITGTITSMFGSVISTIKGMWDGLVNIVSSKISSAFEADIARITSLISKITDFAKGIPLIGGIMGGQAAAPQTQATTTDSVGQPLANSTNQIQSAWTGFSGWFGGLMGDLSTPAEDAGNALISALNCNPTVRIPLAWEAATDQVKDHISSLPSDAEKAGNSLTDTFSQVSDLMAQKNAFQFGQSIASGEYFDPKNIAAAANGIKAAAASTWDLATGLASSSMNASGVVASVSDIGAGLAPVSNYSPAISMWSPEIAKAIDLLVQFSGIETLLSSTLFVPITAVIGSLVAYCEVLTTEFNVVGSIIGSVAYVLQIIPGFIEGSKLAFSETFKDFPNVFAPVRDAFSAFADWAVKTFFGIKWQIQELLAKIFAPMPDYFAPVRRILSAVINFVVETFKLLPLLILAPIRLLLAGIGTLMSKGFGLLGSVLQLFLSQAKNVINAFTQAVMTPLLNVFNKVSGYLANLFAPIFSVFEPVIQYFSDIFASIGNVFNSGVAAIQAYFQGLVAPINAYIEDVFKTVSDFAALGLAKGKEWGYGITKGMLDGISSGWQAITGLLASIPGIGGMFSGINMGGMGESMGSVFTSAITTIQSAWSGFSNWFAGLMNFIPSWAVKAGEALIAALNCHPTVVIPESWQDAIARIAGFIWGLVPNAIKAALQLIDGIAKAVGSLFSIVTGFFSQLTSSAVSTVVAMNLPFLASAAIFAGFAIAAGLLINKFVNVKMVASGVLMTLTGMFKGVTATLELIKNVGSSISTIFKGLVSRDLELVKLGLSNIVASFKLYGEKMSAAFSSAFSGVAQTAQGLTERIAGPLKNSLMSAVSSFQRIKEDVQIAFSGNFVETFTESVKTNLLIVGNAIQRTRIMLSSAFDVGLATARLSFNWLKETAVNVFSAIANWVDSAIANFSVFGSSIRDSFINAFTFIQDGFNNLDTVVPMIFSNISSSIQGSIETLKQIFSDFFGGIKAGWDKLHGAVDALFVKMKMITGRSNSAAQAVENVTTSADGTAPAATATPKKSRMSRFFGGIGEKLNFGRNQPTAEADIATASQPLALDPVVAAAPALQQVTQPIVTIPSPSVQPVAMAAATTAIPSIIPTVSPQATASSVSSPTRTDNATTSGSPGGIRKLLGTTTNLTAAIAPQISTSIATALGLIETYDMVKDVAPDFKNFLGDIQDFGAKAYATLQDKLPGAVSFFSDRLKNLSPIVSGAFQGLKDKAQTAIPAIGQFAKDSGSKLMDLGKSAWASGIMQSGANALVGSSTAILATIFQAMGIAGAASWAAVLGPILAVVVAIGILVAAVWVVWNVFKGVFSAIASVVGFVVEVITTFFITLFTETIGVFSSIGETISQEMNSIWQLLVELGKAFIEPFAPLMELFGGGGGFSIASVIKPIVTAILIPLRIVVGIISIIIKAVAFLVKILITVFTVFTKMWLTPLKIVVSVFATIIRAVMSIGSYIWSAITNPFQSLLSIITFVPNLLIGAWGNAFSLIGGIINTLIVKPFQYVLGLLQKIPFVGKLLGGGQAGGESGGSNVQKFATGGFVQGLGTTTSDNIPAFLSPGEFVVSGGPAQKYAGFLQAINNGETAENALQLLPTTPPRPLSMPPGVVAGGGATESSAAGQTFQFHYEHSGDIIINGESSPDQAKQLLDILTPELERFVVNALRERAERMR